ncbi:MAG TPA: isoprenylcysteine carboxylmethyltransferase family protein [Candidatus Limnocylindrales bacterium]|nr:isoprenylcysteine carboxylmethyltransferase family protein [Candidatus Limnocylindrales bacterium]
MTGGSSIPSLGPKGEGWVVLQVACFGLIAFTTEFRAEVPASIRDVTIAVGVAIALVGLAVVVWAAQSLGRAGSFTAVPRPRSDGSLVSDGPYRWVRHPVYFGLIVIGLGVAIERRSLATLGATALLFVILDLKRRREEAWLRARYADYDAYARGRRALVPFVY